MNKKIDKKLILQTITDWGKVLILMLDEAAIIVIILLILEGMIGEQGRVVKPLTPVGVITVKGEYWSAKSVDDSIEADENVEIVGLEGLTLMVKRKGH